MLYILIDSDYKDQKTQERVELLTTAARKLSVKTTILDSRKNTIYDIDTSIYPIVFKPGKSKSAYSFLSLLQSEKVITFYNGVSPLLLKKGFCFHQNADGIVSTPKSIILHQGIDPDLVRPLLEKQLSYPFISKLPGTSRGNGVKMISHSHELDSFLSRMNSLDINSRVSVMEYIPHDYQYRLVFLGDKVVAAHINYASSSDFRTNSIELHQRKMEPYSKFERFNGPCKKLMQRLGSDFAGIDVITDKRDGKEYFIEVNAPCGFQLTQNVTGIDIAYQMVKYLLEKREKIIKQIS